MPGASSHATHTDGLGSDREQVPPCSGRYLKSGYQPVRIRMLYDLTAIDEPGAGDTGQMRRPADFTLIYHLFSYDRNEYLRS